MAEKHLLALCIAGTLLMLLFVTLQVISLVFYRRRFNRHHFEKQHLLAANLEEGERTMGQIAKEIHDNIGQIAHFLRMTLRRIAKTSDENEKSRLTINANNLTDLIVRQTRHIGNSLNSDFIKRRGFLNVLQDDLEFIRTTENITCYIEFTGEQKAIQPDKELVIYRIAQEAIHNILKHAKATQINFKIEFREKEFIMQIKDNGIGFDQDDVLKNGGTGLMNMKQRAQLLNAGFNIKSEPGVETLVTLTVNYLYL